MTTRKAISKAVLHSLVETNMSKSNLAERMGISAPYMSRKISDGRWTVDDLDLLAEIFGINPEDFVAGGYGVRLATTPQFKHKKESNG